MLAKPIPDVYDTTPYPELGPRNIIFMNHLNGAPAEKEVSPKPNSERNHYAINRCQSYGTFRGPVDSS